MPVGPVSRPTPLPAGATPPVSAQVGGAEAGTRPTPPLARVTPRVPAQVPPTGAPVRPEPIARPAPPPPPVDSDDAGLSAAGEGDDTTETDFEIPAGELSAAPTEDRSVAAAPPIATEGTVPASDYEPQVLVEDTSSEAPASEEGVSVLEDAAPAQEASSPESVEGEHASDGAPPSAPAAGVGELLEGEVLLGQFTIIRKIGSGGFGSVWLADQIGASRKAVVKLAHANLANDPIFRERFTREAKLLGNLDSQHLVKLYNFGDLGDGQLFLVMEYGGDRSLAEELKKKGRVELHRALNIAAQVCEALQTAHESREAVVHRDLKPANILLGERNGEEWVKVVDVGIAKILGAGAEGEDSGNTLTIPGGLNMTPEYASPEQCAGKSVDQRSDLYSMGIVLYEMLTGKLPIVGATRLDFIRAHAMDEPTPASAHGIAVSPEVEAIILTALAKDPAQRFQSAREMREAIVEALTALPTAKRAPANPRVRVARPPPRQASRGWVVPVILLIAAGTFAGVWFATHRKAPLPIKPPVTVQNTVTPPPPAPPPNREVPPLQLKIVSPDDRAMVIMSKGTPVGESGDLQLHKERGTILMHSESGHRSFEISYQRVFDDAQKPTSDLQLSIDVNPASDILRDDKVLAPAGKPATLRLLPNSTVKISLPYKAGDDFDLLLRSQVPAPPDPVVVKQ